MLWVHCKRKRKFFKKEGKLYKNICLKLTVIFFFFGDALSFFTYRLLYFVLTVIALYIYTACYHRTIFVKLFGVLYIFYSSLNTTLLLMVAHDMQLKCSSAVEISKNL